MRTINQGQLLVIFDELSVQHPDHDPFLNAAYFHLWCIERYCNFPEICAKLNVSAEGRAARKEEGGKNRFCLQLGEEEKVVKDFVEACRADNGRGIVANPWVAHCPESQTNGCPHFDQPSVQYEGTLCHQLVVTKLHYGGEGRINLRKDREDKAGYRGANITRHLGDLSKEAELREYSRTHKNQNQLKPTKTGRCYRADGEEIEEEEQPGSSRSEPGRPQTHEPPAAVSPYQGHGTKRNRGESAENESLVQANKKRRPGPEFKTPEWNPHPSSRDGVGKQEFGGLVDFDGEMTTTSPPQSGRSTSTNRRQSTPSEDESEGEIKLALLAAQKRRRALEIENMKATEDALGVKLEKMNKKKRAREKGEDDGDGSCSRREKRQRA